MHIKAMMELKKTKKLNDKLHRSKNIDSLVSLPFGPYQQQWYNHGQTDLSFEFSDHTNSKVKQGRGSKSITLLKKNQINKQVKRNE